MENNLIRSVDVYISIVGFNQYSGVNESGEEIHQTTYKLHITQKDGGEWINPFYGEHNIISALKTRVEKVGVIDLNNWLKLEEWEKLRVIEFKNPAHPIAKPRV
ncbi:hypothetical protein [Vibrio sp. THAF190c]|jgi:hypothetical protein|uniref:hypothetical protein n=1 Tax=Vibrio sp. THAF190c TaxID=2587865 RepID=UPI00126921D0|nr:hypothetical protein [Vibrio sp. THAF190c]QFT13449.1 hypothetical protein FIV04_26200 [Vibrio sp. THAF190c]